MQQLSEQERDIRIRLRDDFQHYASKCLRIRPKDPRLGLQPFILNEPQAYVHKRLEEQRRTTGKVRALILKGRQEGISTYVGGRFYHRVTHSRGVSCYILTHEQKATDNLFGMAVRYHENCPPLVRPSTGAANAKELMFDKLDSGYAIGTAGTKAVGRSNTFQLFHGSEVAFWPNAKDHFAGVVQTVPDLPETEIILESTANGVGNEFHTRWQEAEAGQGDYIAVFVPWFWLNEYRKELPTGFKLDEDERTYQEAYGLDLEQMAWRRAKIIELGSDGAVLFKQEYPATAAEAFQFTGHDAFIKPETVVRARKNNLQAVGPLILGVDPKRFGKDRFSIAWRRGRKVLKIESKPDKMDGLAGANWVRSIIDADKPARVFTDVGGVGASVYDFLNAWGYAFDPMNPNNPKGVVVPIDFGGSPQQSDIFLPSGEVRPGPYNRRAEMWSRSRDWLEEPGGADIPDDDSLQADACGPGYHYNSNSYLLLESKEHMMEVRKLRSPDEWDAVALTFAEPVAEPMAITNTRARSLARSIA
jgi:hypothetical protein